MRIGFSCGWSEEYWTSWPWATMYGGSEHILVELAVSLAAQGHDVTVRLPRHLAPRVWRGVRWVGTNHPMEHYNVLFSFDNYSRRDQADRCALVACRSDPPKHRDFDRLIFLSKTHLELMNGQPGDTWIGGGVNLEDYRYPRARSYRRVICTSSPDRCPSAARIGSRFDFVQTYKWPGREPLSREELVALQLTAQVLIYPLDPIRPSDFFSMAVLEAMAAGTPVVVSDADAMPELWSDAAIVLPRPIDYGEWDETVDRLLGSHKLWDRHSALGLGLAQRFDWREVAQRYFEAALSN